MDVSEASLRDGCRQSMPAWRRSVFSCSVGERKIMNHFVVKSASSPGSFLLRRGAGLMDLRFMAVMELPPVPRPR
jgi:hypothetical protein